MLYMVGHVLRKVQIMFNLQNTQIYFKLLNILNIRGKVQLANEVLTKDFILYAKLTRGLDLTYSEFNGNFIVSITGYTN
jgi:hypothetical protein